MFDRQAFGNLLHQGLHACQIPHVERSQRRLSQHVFAKGQRRTCTIGLERLFGMFAGTPEHILATFDQLFCPNLPVVGALAKCIHHFTLKPFNTERLHHLLGIIRDLGREPDLLQPRVLAGPFHRQGNRGFITRLKQVQQVAWAVG